jgi:Protein of unknown function (DUF2992)
MEESVGTVLFNGQFWIFLLERINANKELYVGKYIFGSEPTNNDLLVFYLTTLPYLKVYKSSITVRTKVKKCIKEQERITSKAKNIYKELQKKNLDEKNKGIKELEKINDQEKYLLKKLKAKEKHKGH